MKTKEQIMEELKITNMLIKQNKELLLKHFNINIAIAIHVLEENKSQLLWILEDEGVTNEI